MNHIANNPAKQVNEAINETGNEAANEARTITKAEMLNRLQQAYQMGNQLYECIGMMNEFIAAHPELWYEDIGQTR